MLHTDFTAHVLGQLVRVNTRYFKKKTIGRSHRHYYTH